MTALACCGLDCQACNYRSPTQCPGCPAAGGNMLWGECPLAKCCIGKGLEHCGTCEQFPCERLNAFAFDKEHGDNGRRIENLRSAK
jgi:hypothetical protein